VDCRSLPFLVGNCGLTSIAISREKLQNVINPVFLRLAVETNQGDQIGRIFALWAAFEKIFRRSQIFGYFYSSEKAGNVLIVPKNK
jgi:hypothetical protein